MSTDDIKGLCSLYNIKPDRSQGQIFLMDKNILAKITETADLSKEDIVLEVGAGLGVLTKALAPLVKEVVAVEQDREVFKVLKKEMAKHKNVELLNSDIFKVDFTKLKSLSGDFKIVANIPYNITSLFIRNFLSQKPKPTMMVLLVQKEVAKRIVARPGQMSLLAVAVQYYSQPTIICQVKKGCFWPVPAVDSAILKIDNIKNNLAEDNDFFKLVKVGFSSKRKQLQNNLVNGYGFSHEKAIDLLEKAGFKSMIRAQELSVEDWQRLKSFLDKT